MSIYLYAAIYDTKDALCNALFETFENIQKKHNQ